MQAITYVTQAYVWVLAHYEEILAAMGAAIAATSVIVKGLRGLSNVMARVANWTTTKGDDHLVARFTGALDWCTEALDAAQHWLQDWAVAKHKPRAESASARRASIPPANSVDMSAVEFDDDDAASKPTVPDRRSSR